MEYPMLRGILLLSPLYEVVKGLMRIQLRIHLLRNSRIKSSRCLIDIIQFLGSSIIAGWSDSTS